MRKNNEWFLVVFVYTAGVLLRILVGILERFGWLSVFGMENVELALRAAGESRRGMLVVANHPSLFEPVVLPILFSPWILRNPLRYFPWSVPDRANFLAPWYLWWFRKLRTVPVQRNEKGERSDSGALRAMLRILVRGEHLIIFPEGTRTHKAVKAGSYYQTSSGKCLGALRQGVGMLAAEANPVCVPVWVDGVARVLPQGARFPRFWNRATFTFGAPFTIAATRDKEGWARATEIVAEKLLALAESSPRVTRNAFPNHDRP